MARCSIEVPSVRVVGKDSDDLPSSLPDGADCSRMALDMAVVSPLRSDSNTRKSFTDCSIDDALGAVGDVGDVWKLGEEGLWPSVGAPTLDMLVDRCGWCLFERLRWWLGRFCEEEPGCCEPAADEPGGEESLRSAVLVTSLLDDTRPSMCFTFWDLLRLCVLWRGQYTGTARLHTALQALVPVTQQQ
jgi:hypothetical protein